MKRVLITGGAGFIGSHLAERLLKAGNEVVVLDNLMRGNKLPKEIMKDIKFLQGDVRKMKDVRKAAEGCDQIYHFAAVLGVDIVADSPVETMDTEFLGMKNVADFSLANNVEKIIYSSTSGIYGHSAIEKSFTESISVDPRTSYAVAKRFNEIYLKALHEEKGLQSVSIRLFNVYGPRQDTRMVIPRFIAQAHKGEPLTVYGKGIQTRDFTYIDDTIDAITKLAQKVNGCEVFNISNEEEVRIRDLATEILKLTGSRSVIEYAQVPKKRYDYEVERRVGNSEKLFKTTGYKPVTRLKEGLKKLLSREGKLHLKKK